MNRIGYVSANTDKAKKILSYIIDRYDLINIEKEPEPEQQIDVLIVLGGDGFMLRNIHRYMNKKVQMYGINCGTLGFLLNEYQHEIDLISVINSAYSTNLTPFKVVATDCNGAIYHTLAMNEVSVFRRTYQAAFIQVKINGVVRLDKLTGDGLLVATAAGSSAYNFSAGGPILPINSRLIALTGINTFRPRRWEGALLPDNVRITLEVINSRERPVIVAADHNELHDIEKIEISADMKHAVALLFSSQSSLNERIIAEQFLCN